MKLINQPSKINFYKSKYLAMSWAKIEKTVTLFKNQLKKIGDFDELVVLVRGAMVPAVMLSHYLDNRNLSFAQGLKTNSNKPHDYGSFRWKKQVNFIKGRKYLIIEDIIFEGDTVFNTIKDISQNGGKVIGVCSLVMDEDFMTNERFKNIPLICGFICPHLKWIRFPWEKKIKGEIILKSL